MTADLMRYHPVRYAKGRAWIRNIERAYGFRVDPVPALRIFQEISLQHTTHYNNDISGVPRDERPESMRVAIEDQAVLMTYLSFVGAGRNIFHFSDALAAMLRRTDVDEFAIGDLRLPFPVIYMSFGTQPDCAPFGDGALVDGAYVTLSGECLQIKLMTRSPHSTGPWFNRFERYYYQSFSAADQTASVVQLSEQALASELVLDEKAIAEHEAFCSAHGGLSRMRRTAEERRADMQAGYDAFKQGLRMIVNGIAYVTAYRDDIERRYAGDVPASVLTDLREAKTPGARRRAEGKIRAGGFSTIHLCGVDFERAAAVNAHTGSKATHWRRGHWRRQPVGPLRADRKLIWIMPALINPGGSVERGHVYLAKQEAQ